MACAAPFARCREKRPSEILIPVKRVFDVALAALAATVLAIPMIVIALLVRVTSSGPAIYWSDRIGANNRVFRMPKFRTMRVGTPPVATHLLRNPVVHL